MTRPLFSVILPTYNRARFLRAAVKSVLAQTCADYECLVLDDGSTDETAAVCDEFRGAPRLEFFRFEDNRRQHARRNFALTRAQGRFITFLDSDDLWLPSRLEAFAAAIAARPQTDFWFSNAYLLRDGLLTGTVFDRTRAIEDGRVPGWHAVGDRFLPYLTSNVAIRKEAFDSEGPFREDMKILEDTELYARMLKAGRTIAAIKDPLAVRRLHETQITRDHDIDFSEAVLALKAGGASDEVLSAETRRLAMTVAGHMLRALHPRQARELLNRELGKSARCLGLYWQTFTPIPLLKAAKALRAEWLKLRYSRLWATQELNGIYRIIESLNA